MGLLEVLKLSPRAGAAAGAAAKDGTKAPAKGKASPADVRDQARLDTVALLTQLTGLANGGIADAALAAKIAKELAGFQSAFDKADKMTDAGAAAKVFVAIQAPAKKLVTRALLFQQLADWHEKTWKPLAAAAATT